MRGPHIDAEHFLCKNEVKLFELDIISFFLKASEGRNVKTLTLSIVF